MVLRTAIGKHSCRLTAAFVISLLSATSQIAPAQSNAVFYVSTTGSDTGGDGSSGSPWATIAEATKKVPISGGTILVRDGTYQGNIFIGRKFQGLLTIRAEHPYRVKLRNSSALTLSIFDSGNLVLTGFDIARTAYNSSPLLIHIGRSEWIALIDNILHDSYNNDVLKINESSRHLLIMGNTFYNQQGGAGQHIDVNGCADVTIRNNIFFNSTAGTGISGNLTHGFIVAKNSGAVPESRDVRILNNVFLNYEGNTGSNFILLGEDGMPFHEVQDVLIENNLMLGNSAVRMRSPFGVKGAKDVLFRNNTISGDLPSSAYAMRMNREGSNPPNRNIVYFNNVWSDPTGTMGNFSDGRKDEATGVELSRNVYWNAGHLVSVGSAYSYADDADALIADPLLPVPKSIVLPKWTGTQFQSGAKTVAQEFLRLVNTYGPLKAGSAAIGTAEAAHASKLDILERPRGFRVDMGATQTNAFSPPMRVVLAPETVVGGLSTALNQVVLSQPAPAGGTTVELTSTNPALASVPPSVEVAAGTTFATFRIATKAVTSPQQASIGATSGSSGAYMSMAVVPAAIHSVNLGPDEIVGGKTSTHNLVWLDGVAGAAGTTITLSCSKPALVTIPASVKVAAGNSYSDYFPVATKDVSSETVVTITAAWGSSKKTTELTLLP